MKVEFPSGDGASAALAGSAIWARVNDEPELEVRASAAVERPTATVLLIAGALDREERGLSTRSLLGQEGARWEALPGTQPGSDRLRDRARALVYVRRLDLAGARRTADAVTDALLARVPSLSPSALRRIRFVFEELCANVVQHSGAARTGVGWAAVDPDAGRKAVASSCDML